MRNLARNIRLAVCAALLATVGGAAHAQSADGATGTSLLVPISVIYPGDEISAGMVAAQRFRVSDGAKSSYAQTPQDLVGKIARRTLMRGQPIPFAALRVKDVVVQGRTYALIYSSEFVKITGTGVPLQSGAAGDVINVRNPDTGVIVKARVAEDQSLVVEAQ